MKFNFLSIPFLFSILIPSGIAMAKGTCSSYLDFNFMETISFNSGKNNKIRTYVGSHLSSSASRVYLVEGGLQIIKVYDSSFEDTTFAEEMKKFKTFSLPFLEMVRLRFLLDLGFHVPMVLDFSDSIFNPQSSKVVVVKSFLVGKPADSLLDLSHIELGESGSGLKYHFLPKKNSGLSIEDADALADKINLLSDLIKKSFISWLARQTDLTLYYKYAIENSNAINKFDLHYTNWIRLENGEWTLIDP